MSSTITDEVLAAMESGSKYWRQLDILDPRILDFSIVVVGAGAIGSAASVTLAKMGVTNLQVIDGDILEIHNVPNQMCFEHMVGTAKVEALAELIKLLSGVEIIKSPYMWDNHPLEGAVICTVDSMDVRKRLWEKVKMNLRVPLFIDARMGAELLRLYSIIPTDVGNVELYEQNLYDDAEKLPCSARSIIYCPAVAGAFIAQQVKAFAAGQPLCQEIIFDLPSMRIFVKN